MIQGYIASKCKRAAGLMCKKKMLVWLYLIWRRALRFLILVHMHTLANTHARTHINPRESQYWTHTYRKHSSSQTSRHLHKHFPHDTGRKARNFASKVRARGRDWQRVEDRWHWCLTWGGECLKVTVNAGKGCVALSTHNTNGVTSQTLECHGILIWRCEWGWVGGEEAWMRNPPFP